MTGAGRIGCGLRALLATAGAVLVALLATAPTAAADTPLTIVAPTGIIRPDSDMLFVSLRVRGTLPTIPPPGSTNEDSPQPEYELFVQVTPQGTQPCDPATPHSNAFGLFTYEEGNPGSSFSEQVIPNANSNLLGHPVPHGPKVFSVCAWLAPEDPSSYAAVPPTLAPVAFTQSSFRVVAPSDSLRVSSPRSVRAGRPFMVSVRAQTTRIGDALDLLVYRTADLSKPLSACSPIFGGYPPPVLAPIRSHGVRGNVRGGHPLRRRVRVRLATPGSYRVCGLLGAAGSSSIERVVSRPLTVLR